MGGLNIVKPLSFTRTAVPPSRIRELMALADAMPGVLHLEAGIPDFSTPRFILEAAAEAAGGGFTTYTPNAGLRSLRGLLLQKVREENNLDVGIDSIVVTHGATGGLALLLPTLADAGEEILIPDPAWPDYEMLLIAAGIRPRRYPLCPEKGFQPDLGELEDLVVHQTKALLINSPANPSGAVFPRESMLALYEFAREHDLYLISDEVYEHILFDVEHVSPAQFDTDGRVISVFSFSKEFAMTGWRIGYVVAPPSIAEVMTRLQEPYYSCANSVAQKAAEVALLRGKEVRQSMVVAYRQRRDIALAMLPEELVLHEPQGAFYLLLDVSPCPVADGYAFARALLGEKRVAVAPGPAFGEVTKQAIRVSLCAAERELVRGLERILEFMKG